MLTRHRPCRPAPGRDRSKGLGLAIVDRLARLLRIPVTLESEPGKGSRFSVDLLRARHSEMNNAARDVAAARTRDNLAGTLVVVVDDESPMLDATRTLLEMWGCKVVTASSGREALELLGSSPRVPDILVCDYRLRDQ